MAKSRKSHHKDHHIATAGSLKPVNIVWPVIRVARSLVNNFRWHYSWMIPAILFIIHQLLQQVAGISIKFADAYLDPFCAGSLALWAISFERRLFFGQERLTLADMLVTTGYIIFVSEVVFPIISKHSVADWFDVIAILLGLVWFSLTRPK